MPTVPGQRFAGKHDNDPSNLPSVTPTAIAEHKGKKELWDFVVADLENRKLMASTYVFTITNLVENVYKLQEERAQLDKEGTVLTFEYKGGGVGTKMNPRFNVVNSLDRMVRADIEKLGMTPRDIVFLARTDPSADEVITDGPQDGTVVTFRD